MTAKIGVLFLCAGFGTRLQPLTKRIPKPLITFEGKTALKINLEKVQKLQPHKIVCNSHHLHRQVEKEAEKLGITAIYESQILGTAGPLSALSSHFADCDYVLVHNADILHNMDLEKIFADNMGDEIGILLGINIPSLNTLCLTDNSMLEGVKDYNGYLPVGNKKALTMSGIALYKREFLNYCPKGFSDIKEAWTKSLSQGKGLKVVDVSHYAWMDFGNPKQLWDARCWFQKNGGGSGIQTSVKSAQNRVFNEANWKHCPPEAKNLLVYEIPTKGTDFDFSDDRAQIIGRDFLWEIDLNAA